MHPLAERVLSHIRRQELLKPGDRVGVAVSGGIDSVALLRLLLELRGELGIVLSVVHFNHKLRGSESDGDQEFVASLARSYELEFHVDGDDVGQRAVEGRVSVETAARELRYGFFRHLLGEGGEVEALTSPKSGEMWGTPLPNLNKIVTGHMLDDQAETVLMRLIRGSGFRGLGGIHPRLFLEGDEGEAFGEIIRPLLAVRRCQLEQYLRDIGQEWREDSSNADEHFTRNRVRKLVIPLLEREFNPSVAENLSELAEVARGEEDYWENEVSGWLGTTVQWREPEWARDVTQEQNLPNEQNLVQIALPWNHSKGAQLDPELQARIDDAPWLVVNAAVSRMWLLGEPVGVQRRLVKAIGERARIPLEFKHVEEILRFAGEDGASGKALSLPLGWKVVREPHELIFVTPDLREPVEPRDYEYELHVPGCVALHEAGLQIEAQCVTGGAEAGYNPEQLLDARSLPRPLRVRNWRPGDRFWPAHTKSPKKIKELLQERHVAQPERRLWPVVVSGNEIVWLRGFPLPSRRRAEPGREAILITEKPLSNEPEN